MRSILNSNERRHGTAVFRPIRFGGVVAAGMLVAATLAAAGCGAADPPMYPLQGKVLYNGKPIPKAEMVFHPLASGPGWMPVATVGDDGSFAASTKQPGDGALAGKYKVTVVWHAKATDDDPGLNYLPPRYAQPNTSGLVVEAGPTANAFATLELKN